MHPSFYFNDIVFIRVLAFAWSFLSAGMAIYVYVRNLRSSLNKLWSLVSLCVGLWCFGSYQLLTAPDRDSSLVAVRLLHAAAILLPAFHLHFTYHLLEIPRPRWWLVRWMYGVSLALFLANFTAFFIRDVIPKPYFHFYAVPGPLYHLFTVIYFGASACWTMLLGRSLQRLPPLRRNQVKYVLIASVVGILGGASTFPLIYDIPLPPYPALLVAFYPVLIAYTIVRYRLMDIQIAITRGVIFMVVYACVLGLPFGVAALGENTFKYLLGEHWWSIPLGLMALLATLGHYLNLFLQRKAEARLLREQRHYQATLMHAAKGMVQVRDLHRLLNLVVHILTRAMKLTHAGIFLLDEKTGCYVLRVSRDRDALVPGLILEAGDPVIEWLKEKQVPLVSEEVKQLANGTISPATLEASLKRIEASVIVPSFTEETLMGFLVLGDKRTGQMYSQDDLNTLQILANQAALALQNAQFYEELQTTTAQLIHNSKLTAMGKMASGMSHQIHNRLYVLAVEAGALRADLLQRLRVSALPEAERQALLDKLDASLQSIEEESVKGSTIVKSLLQFSKPTTDMKLVSLQEIVQGGLTMVSLKRDLKQLTLHLDIPESLPSVKVNVTQLQDVFFNLVDNAYDAIDSKAERIRLGLLHVAESSQPYQGVIMIRAAASDDRRKLLVTVSDNGMGMTSEERDRLFLPFYTTKATAEKGSGLGLFVIREILKSHGGTIRLQESEYGKRTAFLVELSLSEQVRA